MKTFLLVILFIGLSIYYFVPNELKNEYLEKAWINYSFEVEDDSIIPWEAIILNFDKEWKSFFSWNIKNWIELDDLTWASQTYVSCFKKDAYKNFNWKHTFHKILLERNKSIEIKLIDETENNSLSLYAYKIKPDSENSLPPHITYTHQCVSKINTNSDKIININWNTIKSEILVWVVWAEKSEEWFYKLDITQK